MRRRRLPAPPPDVHRYWGKSTGPGPWHLLATATAGKARCGRTVRTYHGFGTPPAGHKICWGCVDAEQNRLNPERTAT